MIIADHVSKISLFTNHGRVAITNHVRIFSSFTVTLPKKRPITDHGKRSYPPSVSSASEAENEMEENEDFSS
jgi:hypothetical protein